MGPAAENLNGFNDADIATRLGALNHDQLIWLYTAALGGMSGISQRRILDPIGHQDIEAAYQACLRTGRWADLATVLNGFSDADITTHIATLSADQTSQLLANVPPALSRVRAPLLDARWTAAVAAGQWGPAAENLTGSTTPTSPPDSAPSTTTNSSGSTPPPSAP